MELLGVVLRALFQFLIALLLALLEIEIVVDIAQGA